MLLSVARVNRLFGVDGGVMINLYSAFPDNFSIEDPLFAKIDSLAVPLFCEKFERRGHAGAVVQFADFDNEQRVDLIMGSELFIEEREPIEDDEFYMEDLIGFKVLAGGVKGRVTDYIDNPLNPLFEIEIDGKLVLIPAVEEFIANIDFKRGVIKVVLPEGLVESQK